MTMNSRKMNNNSLMRVSTVLFLAFALIASACIFPLGIQTGATTIGSKNPNEPNNPIPANGTTNVPISTNLTWVGNPEGDNVTYDVYFGFNSTPLKVASNQSKTIYKPATMNYSTKYYWRIIAWDNHSNSTAGQLWSFTTIITNSPPVFGTPSPTNGSTGQLLDFIWSIPINDSEGNAFSWTIHSSNGQVNSGTNATNGTKTLSLSGLAYSTTYKVWVNATDIGGSDLYTRKWYTFTTKQQTELTVNITKPLENKFYVNNVEKSISLPGNTIVYGKLTITADVTSDSGVTRVEFWVDGKLKFNDTEAPYEHLWQPVISFNGLSLTHTIKVIAYDSEGHNATAQINVTKWRFHPLPFILAGVALASRLVLHTTVVGLFYKVQESRFSVSFYAIRAHYKTVGPFQLRKGTIHFKSCTGGIIIGPTTLTKIGPFHKFAIGSFTFIGGLSGERTGLGGALLSRLLQPRNTGGTLLNLARSLRQ
jgi:hypothetical protein